MSFEFCASGYLEQISTYRACSRVFGIWFLEGLLSRFNHNLTNYQ